MLNGEGSETSDYPCRVYIPLPHWLSQFFSLLFFGGALQREAID